MFNTAETDQRVRPDRIYARCMGLRFVAVVAALSMGAFGCAASETTATLGELDSAVSRMIPTSGVLGDSVAQVSLPDAGNGGEPMPFVGPDGGVLVAYFGYTFCPDVCPTTLSDLRTALADIGDDASRVEVAMATIDPGRDSDDVLTDYLQYFFPEGHPLRTEDDAELRAAAETFGVQYSVVEGINGTTEVTHSAFLFAIDDTGEIRAVWPFGVESETISAGLEAILSGA
jgi:protein SCO1/2